MLGYLLHHVEGTPGVHAHDEVVVFLGGVREDRRLVYPCIVQQQVYFAKFLNDMCDGGNRLFFAGHIQLEVSSLSTRGPNVSCHLGNAIFI